MAKLSRDALKVLAAYNREARPEPHHQCEAIGAAIRVAAECSEYPIFPGFSVISAADLLDLAAEFENAEK